MTNRTVWVRIRGDVSDLSRATLTGARDTGVLRRELEGVGDSLDRVDSGAIKANRSGSALVDTLIMLSPVMEPLAGLAVAGLGGIAAQAGVASGALLTTLLALNGVGDALKAVQTARDDPTVANLEKMEKALKGLPDGTRRLVFELDRLRPQLQQLREAAADGGFADGLIDGINAAENRLPDLLRLVDRLSAAQGTLARRTGESLAGPEWDAFFDMAERQAEPMLLDMGATVGALARSIANALVGLEPLNRQYGQLLRTWAEGIESASETGDYERFMDFIRETGPEVGETLVAVTEAVGSVSDAAGEFAGPALSTIQALANTLSAVADSPAGPVLFAAAAGLAAVNRALVIQEKLRDQLVFSNLTRGRNAVPVSGSPLAAAGAVGTTAVVPTGGAMSSLRAYPRALREVRAAESELAAARKSSRAITAQYVGSLQAANTATARGLPRTVATTNRLADGLSKVELANRRVADATERARAAEVRRGQAVRANAGMAAKGAAGVAGFAAVSSGVAESMGATNTATLALMGMWAGPYGAAAGAAIGATLDLKAAHDQVADSIDSANRAVASSTATTDTLRQQRKALSDIQKDFNDNTLSRLLEGDFVGAASTGTLDFFGDAIEAVTFTAKGGEDAIDALNKKQADTRAAERARATQHALADGFTLTGRSARLAGGGIAALQADLARFDASTNRFTGLVGYRAAILDVEDAIRQNGRTLNINTREGQSNRLALAALANQAKSYAGQMNDFGRSTAFLERSRGQFIRLARQMGITRSEAAGLADQLGLINRADPNVEVKVRTEQAMSRKQRLEAELKKLSGMVSTPEVRARTERARAQLAIINNQLNSLRNREIYVTTYHRDVGIVRQTGVGAQARSAQAAGGMWRGGTQYFAGGGMWGTSPDVRNGHVAHMARAGTWRVFAEDETKGESYIPHADDWRRPRARQILEDTARILGARTVQWNAAGGTYRGPSSMTLNPEIGVVVRVDGLDMLVRGTVESVNTSTSRIRQAQTP